MARKKFILFDHDGVLVETEPLYFKANQEALAEIGIGFFREQWLAFNAEGTSCWVLAEQQNISKLMIDRARIRRNEHYQSLLRSEDIDIPGVLDTLAELSKSHEMAIVTTAKKEDFDLIHEHRSILDWMSFVLTSNDYQAKKPLPDPYLAGLARFGAEAIETVVVEDSARGLKSAVAAGIDCIIVDNEFTRGQDFSEACAIVQSISDLPHVLEGL